jgi:hypothetical protein
MARVDADHPQPGSGVPSADVAGLDPGHLAFLLHWVTQSGGRLVIELDPRGDRTSIEVLRENATAGRDFLIEWQRGGAIARRSASDATPEVLAAELGRTRCNRPAAVRPSDDADRR